MIDIYLVYDNKEDLKKLQESTLLKGIVFIHAYNINKHKDRNAGLKLKHEWGAKELPFASLVQNGKCIKCFYSEMPYEFGNDIITQIINFINNENI